MEIVSALEYGKISVQVVNLPSIKPLDVNAIIQLGKITRAAVTLEDHNIIGGMGSMIAEIYAEYLQKPVKRMGINDTFTESADADLLRERYGLGNKTILKAISTLLNNQ